MCVRVCLISSAAFQYFFIRHFVLITFPDFLKDGLKINFYIFLPKASALPQMNNSLSFQALSDCAGHFSIWDALRLSSRDGNIPYMTE